MCIRSRFIVLLDYLNFMSTKHFHQLWHTIAKTYSQINHGNKVSYSLAARLEWWNSFRRQVVVGRYEWHLGNMGVVHFLSNFHFYRHIDLKHRRLNVSHGYVELKRMRISLKRRWRTSTGHMTNLRESARSEYLGSGYKKSVVSFCYFTLVFAFLISQLPKPEACFVEVGVE